MGRPAKKTKNAHLPENSLSSLERGEPQTRNGNIKLLEGVDYQHESSQPKNSPSEFPNSLVDGVGTHHERSSTREKVNPRQGLQETSALRGRKSKYHTPIVRRSQRIKSAVVQSSNHDIDYNEEICLSDGGKDEPITQMKKVLAELELEPVENLTEKSLAEKVDYALRRLEFLEKNMVSIVLEVLEKNMELFKTKVGENIGLDESASPASSSYKSMYTASQKKLEAIKDENRRLAEKLENAFGKIEVYEKESHVLIAVLDKVKDALNAAAISNLAKTTEVAQAIHNACCAYASAKRKRNVRDT